VAIGLGNAKTRGNDIDAGLHVEGHGAFPHQARPVSTSMKPGAKGWIDLSKDEAISQGGQATSRI
jgi:hypothetical protein